MPVQFNGGFSGLWVRLANGKQLPTAANQHRASVNLSVAHGHGGFAKPVNKAIAWSVAATVLAVAIASWLPHSATGRKIAASLNARVETTSAAKRTAGLLEDLRSAGPDERSKVLANFVADIRPEYIIPVVGILRGGDATPRQRALSVELGVAAGLHYANRPLMQTAAAELVLGRFIPKDLTRARQLLGNPVMAGDRITDFTWGLWWSSASNPERNLAEARKALQKALDGGYGPAVDALKRLPPN